MKGASIFLAVIFLSCISSIVIAQPKKLFIYGEAGIGVVNFSGGRLGINTIVNKNIITGGFWSGSREAMKLPLIAQKFLVIVNLRP